MPTNLGALASNRPAPIARNQRGYGGWVGGTVQFYENWNGGTPLPDGAGGGFPIYATPNMPCFWVVEAQVMSIWSSGDAAYYAQLHFGIRIDPADADGVVLATYPSTCHQASIPWRTTQSSYMFRLNAGVAYTAKLTMESSSGWYQLFHQNPLYTHLNGLLVAEGTA